jgi:hypothetical protein
MKNLGFIAVLSEIEDPKILSIYSKLMKAASESEKSTIRDKQLEPAIKEYLESKSNLIFKRGTGQEPDFIVEWDTKKQGVRPEGLLDIELKAKTSEALGIKIGGAAVSLDVLRSFNIINTSELSILRSAPLTFANNKIKLPVTSPAIIRSDLLQAFAKENTEYIYSSSQGGLLKYAQNKRPLLPKIEKDLIEKFKESEKGKEIIEKYQTKIVEGPISQQYLDAAAIVKRLNDIRPNQNLFDYLKKMQPASFEALKKKSKNVIVTFPTSIKGITGVSSLKTAAITFQGDNYFNSNNFYIKIKKTSTSSLTFFPYVKTPIEKRILQEFAGKNFKAAEYAIKQDLSKLQKKIVNIKYSRKGISDTTLKIPATFYAAVLGDGEPGSIPQGRVRVNIPRRKSSAFTSRTAPARRLLRETKQPSMGDFITNDTITALTQREMMRRMPIGPVVGPPLSRKVLTYRTGRFVESLKVIADMRSQAMQYYYDPRYWIHETTSRNPRDLIDSSLNSVTRNLFSKRFNLVKAERSL